MLTYAMGVSLDGYVADRDGAFDWGAPSEELFDFHLEHVAGLGAYLLGRRLYEAMRVWETDPALRSTESFAAFAEVWTALPKVVFSRTLERVEGNARLAQAPLADEIAEALGTHDGDVSIGGATLAQQAIELGLMDELRILRYPIVVGGGTSYFPAVTGDLRFELVETRTFAPSIAFERYRSAG